ncbi:MAG: ABC transporter ATP-binding protein [Acidimicrobiia bacterium]|nr:ABC transporter ATP-binding protein [Acidimicrobiia bacterium]
MNERVACRHLTVAYGDHVAADAVSFTVGRGEVFGLLGPNGAGKTSVIRALTTIIAPRSGSASIAGHELHDQTAIRRRIGVLPESSGYPKAPTGEQYLVYFGRIYGLGEPEARHRADALLERFGLAATTTRISAYSRGMRQRLGLCRAMINNPEVLFLDEPTLGLDPAGKDEIVRHLGELAAANGTTVVLCTHLLDEVERVCDRIAIMNRGAIVATGTVEDVILRATGAEIARLHVHPDDAVGAARLIERSVGAAAVGLDESRPGVIDVALSAGVGTGAAMLRAALDADVEVLGFERHRATLTDAFLELTADQEVAA